VNKILDPKAEMPVSPGLHRDIPFEQYAAWPALSNSALSLFSRSPAHCKAGFGPATEPMKLGSLAHCALLEPLHIVKRYVFMPDYANHPENLTKDGTRSYSSATTFVKTKEDEFRKLHHDKEIVSETFYNHVLGISKSYHGHEVTANLLRDTEKEVSALWWDAAFECWCKARFDVLRLSGKSRYILDLKTCQDARTFDRSIAKFGYHRQAAWYTRGLWATTQKSDAGDRFWFAAVETVAPYGIRTAPMDWQAMDHGYQEIGELISRYRECATNDEWPGYESPDAWTLPSWYGQRNEESVELVIDGEVLEV